jgi:VWFA-related protein
VGARLAEAPPQVRGTNRDVFAEEITVLEVVLPVRVFVGSQPVAGLTARNFEVRDQGQVLPLIGFEAIDLRSISLGAEHQSSSIASHPEQAAASFDNSERSFLALFDLAQSPSHRIELAVRSMRKMVEGQLRPSDRVGVAILSGGGSQLLAPLTVERARVLAALDLVEALLTRKPRLQEKARRNLAAAPRDSLRELTAAVGPAAALALAQGEIPSLVDPGLQRSFGDLPSPIFGQFNDGAGDPASIGAELEASAVTSSRRRLGRYVEELVTLLSGVRGDKYLMYFANGLPNFEAAVQEPLLGSGLLETYVSMTEALVRSGWVLNAFDVMGVGEGNAGSLFYLADETGGELFDNFGHLEVATEQLVERTSVSYRLIFQTPEIRRDGRFRSLDVTLLDAPAGARVQGMLGYNAPKAERQKTRLERRLEEIEAGFREPDREDFPAHLVLLNTPLEGPRRRITLLLEVEGQALLRALPRNGLDRRFALELMASASDGQLSSYQAGSVVDVLRERIALPSDEFGAALGNGFRFLGDLEVGAGEHEIRVRLRDPRGGATFQTTRIVQGSSADEVDPTGMVAFLASPRGQGVLVRESGTDVHQAGSSPLVLGTEVLLPSRLTSIRRGEQRPLVLRLYGGDFAGVRLGAELRSRDDEALGELPGLWERAVRRQEADGSMVVITTLTTEDLAEGSYRLLLSWFAADTLRGAAGVEFELTP